MWFYFDPIAADLVCQSFLKLPKANNIVWRWPHSMKQVFWKYMFNLKYRRSLCSLKLRNQEVNTTNQIVTMKLPASIIVYAQYWTNLLN